MVANIPFNPQVTTVAGGSFNVQSTGFIQGTALQDPAIRNELAGGWLDTDETIPMWGGVGLYEFIPGVTGEPNEVLGGAIGRATALTGTKALSGFSVFDQNHAAFNTPQSPVPLAGSGMLVNFYRLGSLARLAVKCSPNLSAIRGSKIAASVSWDFTNQMLVPYSAPTFDSGTYSTPNVSLVTAAPHGLLPGDTIIVSGAAGTGDFADINGVHTLITGTTGSTLVFAIEAGLTMTLSGATITTGGQLTTVRVLDVQIGNSMTVAYDDTTGFATWNRSGNTAVILL